MSPNAASPVDRHDLLDWFERTRARSRAIFDLIAPDVYYEKPIKLRHPIVFYEGHLPAFAVNTVIKRGLERPGIDAGLERLFARGIDPADEAAAAASGAAAWPSRAEVQRFAAQADRLMTEAIADSLLDGRGRPLPGPTAAVCAVIEHEAMHQETLLYMWHRLPYEAKQPPTGYRVDTAGRVPARETVRVPAGRVTLGAERARRFGWDNEFEAHAVEVAAFDVDVHDVTNREFLAFVEAGGYRQERWWDAGAWEWIRAEGIEHPPFWDRGAGDWSWRGMFGELPLPPAWPVFVSQAEAAAFARWRGGRLLTEAEYHRAAYGTPDGHERPFPWGDEPPGPAHGHFDFASFDPVAVGLHPAGASAWGVQDLIGNGWEWTATRFGPFPGFRPMPEYPEYSADFFDDRHVVMKGGSPVTDRELLRRSFRNWFRPHYPYVYATFRCAYEGGRTPR